MRVMLIEDDNEAAKFMERGLRNAGHQVDHAVDGAEGLAILLKGRHDVAIVDRLLPHLDGLSIVKMLRAANLDTRVIFVTTLARIDNRVEGLDAGADDYLTKPFEMVELVARVNALGRRHAPPSQTPTVLRIRDLELDLVKRTTTRGGKNIHLQPVEFKLLEALMRQAGRLVTRTMLLEQVWNFRFDPQTTIVETHISRLRAKIDREFPVALIETIHGGYCMRDPLPEKSVEESNAAPG
ncbi:MAG: response regulator [Alphaproteobacteria bacterium]|nr:response regulator [Alphaproteobacteria bacterium]